MKAVNLIPSDAQRSGNALSLRLATPTYGLFGLLIAAVALVTLYVLAGNSVATKQAQLTSLQTQLTQTQTEASRLQSYAQFATLAQTRVQTVRGIAATRFDWNAALANLARVVPANTSLESLNGTVVPGATAGGSGGGGGAGASGATNLRGDITGPAFELNGCTASQDDVARLISRLRVMPGVKRVALGSSVINEQQSQSSAASAAGGCKLGSPTFSLVVFFNQVVGAGATGATTLTAAPSASGTTATATAPATSGGGAQ